MAIKEEEIILKNKEITPCVIENQVLTPAKLTEVAFAARDAAMIAKSFKLFHGQREESWALVSDLVEQATGFNLLPIVEAYLPPTSSLGVMLNQWMTDCCEFGEGFSIPARVAHENFKEWYYEKFNDECAAPPGPKMFSRSLAKILKKGRSLSNTILYSGARIKKP